MVNVGTKAVLYIQRAVSGLAAVFIQNYNVVKAFTQDIIGLAANGYEKLFGGQENEFAEGLRQAASRAEKFRSQIGNLEGIERSSVGLTADQKTLLESLRGELPFWEQREQELGSQFERRQVEILASGGDMFANTKRELTGLNDALTNVEITIATFAESMVDDLFSEDDTLADRIRKEQLKLEAIRASAGQADIDSGGIDKNIAKQEELAKELANLKKEYANVTVAEEERAKAMEAVNRQLEEGSLIAGSDLHKDIVKGIEDSFNSSTASARKAVAEAEKQEKAYRRVMGSVSELAKAHFEYEERLEALNKYYGDNRGADYQRDLKLIQDELKDAQNEANELYNELEDLGKEFDKQSDSIDPAAKALAKYQKTMETLAQASDQFPDRQGEIIELRAKAWQRYTDEMSRANKSVQDEMEQGFQGMQDAWESLFKTIFDGGENLGERAKDLIIDYLIEAVATAAAYAQANPLNIPITVNGGGGVGGAVTAIGGSALTAAISGGNNGGYLPVGAVGGSSSLLGVPITALAGNVFTNAVGGGGGGGGGFNFAPSLGGYLVGGAINAGVGAGLFGSGAFAGGLGGAGNALFTGGVTKYLAGFLSKGALGGLGTGAFSSAISGGGMGALVGGLGYAMPAIGAIIAIASILGNKDAKLKDSGLEFHYGGENTNFRGSADIYPWQEFKGKKWFRSFEETVLGDVDQGLSREVTIRLNKAMTTITDAAGNLGVDTAEELMANFEAHFSKSMGKEISEQNIAEGLDTFVGATLAQALSHMFAGVRHAYSLVDESLQDIGRLGNALLPIVDYAGTSLEEAYAEFAEESGRSFTEQIQAVDQEMAKLAETFDYSIGEMETLRAMVEERYELEIAALAEIEGIINGFGQTVDDRVRNATLRGLNDDDKLAFLQEEQSNLDNLIAIAAATGDAESFNRYVNQRIRSEDEEWQLRQNQSSQPWRQFGDVTADSEWAQYGRPDTDDEVQAWQDLGTTIDQWGEAFQETILQMGEDNRELVTDLLEGTPEMQEVSEKLLESGKLFDTSTDQFDGAVDKFEEAVNDLNNGPSDNGGDTGAFDGGGGGGGSQESLMASSNPMASGDMLGAAREMAASASEMKEAAQLSVQSADQGALTASTMMQAAQEYQAATANVRAASAPAQQSRVNE